MKTLITAFFSLALVACGQSTPEPSEVSEPPSEAINAPAPETAELSLADVLAEQPAPVQKRFAQRNPQETLEFLGIQPGMTVVEALPGGGWYSRILMRWLGPDGQLVGADYPVELYSNFGFMNEERLQAKQTWVRDWVAGTADWSVADSASVAAFVFGALPESMHSSADAVLFVRALHNMARFSTDDNDFLAAAMQDAMDVLKPGGVVGVVQHEARPDMPDDWAAGQNGYLKKSFVVAQFEAAGFELVDEAAVNENPKDQPTTADFVWRLPPSLRVDGDDPARKAELEAIGESHRMTLLFKKPAD